MSAWAAGHGDRSSSLGGARSEDGRGLQEPRRHLPFLPRAPEAA